MLIRAEAITKAFGHHKVLNRADLQINEGDAIGLIGINGAAAHLASVGNLIIIASYAMMDLEEARQWHPTVIFPQHNRLG